jgi:cobalt-zinc-cadmium efflux system protein
MRSEIKTNRGTHKDADHDHGSHEQAQDRAHTHGLAHDHKGLAGTRLLWVILLNLGITVTEYVAGVLSGSLALISDAGHNLSDTLSLTLGYAGERISATPANPRRSFGLKRFEVLVAAVNAATLIGVGVYILIESVNRFMNPQPVDASILLPVAVIGLVGNFVSIVLLHGHKDQNLNMKAAFLHLFYDTLSSVAVIAVGVVLLFWPWYWLDIIISLVIMVMIVGSSLSVLAESLRVLLQIAPANLDPEEIGKQILGIAGVGSLHGLHIWSINSQEVFLSCHVCQSPEEPDIDALISRINASLAEHFNIRHTTIQVETTELCGENPRTPCCD